MPIVYVNETRANIALARNRSIQESQGDFVAFIDDDEFPIADWLKLLFEACDRDGVAGVLGPVLPFFGDGAPRWVMDGGFYDRPRHPTGMQMNWLQTRTGNVLLKSSLFSGLSQPFDPACLEGSDQEFFKRMMAQGHSFIWCDEAIAYEVVPPERWTRNFLIRRALSRGIFSIRNHGRKPRLVGTSMLAAPAFAVALPVALVLGQAKFMNYVFRFSYHAGRLLAVLGLNPIKAYVSE